MALAGLMISELSAGCECRLFGTGLIMSENASDCTQNAAFRDRKYPVPKPHLPRRLDPQRLPRLDPRAEALDLLPLHFHHLPPPHLTLLATGLPSLKKLRCLGNIWGCAPSVLPLVYRHWTVQVGGSTLPGKRVNRLGSYDVSGK